MGPPPPLAIVLVVVLVLEKCFTQRVWSTIDPSSGVISARAQCRGRGRLSRGLARALLSPSDY
jgi:hypothetical protein